MKLKKVISALLISTMTVSLLAGCGGKTDTPAADNSGDTSKTEETKEPEAEKEAESENTDADSETESEAEPVEEQTLKVAAFEGGYGADMWSEVVAAFG